MPLFKIAFERQSEIVNIEKIGKVKNAHIRRNLNHRYGKAQWQKMKGTAKIRLLETGDIWWAEVHFYTADGKEKHIEEIKYLLEKSDE